MATIHSITLPSGESYEIEDLMARIALSEISPLLITITSTTSDATTLYNANKTYVQISEAYANNTKCYVIYQNAIYDLDSYDSNMGRFYFVRTYNNNGLFLDQFMINSSDGITFSSEEITQEDAMYQYTKNVNIGFDNSNIGEYGNTARHALQAGDLFWYGEHQLGRATTNISYGDTLTLNTNYVSTTISDEFKRMPTVINSLIDAALAEYDNGDVIAYGNVDEG